MLKLQGDSRIYSIAAASIIAKISRDRIMQELHIQYPQYNLAKHKVSCCHGRHIVFKYMHY